ncbi:MAG: manganese catalase family protein [Anaerotignum sp.]|nr:manganese catalase family protein [Anaerotignum sp.]
MIKDKNKKRVHIDVNLLCEKHKKQEIENLIALAESPAVPAPLRFLRKRKIVHFQRFGEALDIARDHLNQQHYFFMQKNGCNTK